MLRPRQISLALHADAQVDDKVDVICVIDMTGSIVIANKLLHSMFGCVHCLSHRQIILRQASSGFGGQLFNAPPVAIGRYRRDELLGKNVSILIPAPFAAAHAGYLKRYASTGAVRVQKCTLAGRTSLARILPEREPNQG